MRDGVHSVPQGARWDKIGAPIVRLHSVERLLLYLPPLLGGRTHSPGGEGGGGSIFWKTRDIGLPSYSNNLSTLHSLCVMQSMGDAVHTSRMMIIRIV
jgi:hypothetical protein